MAQLTGSGPGNGTNYVMVDSSVGTNVGRLKLSSNTDKEVFLSNEKNGMSNKEL